MLRSFKELIVWQKSFVLVKEIYKLSKELPEQERFGLMSQMQRAAVSIPSNIAEGSERGGRKDYIQFLRVALGSSVELETQVLLAKDLYNVEIQEIVLHLAEIQKMLTVMIQKLGST